MNKFFPDFHSSLKKVDPEIHRYIQIEKDRQEKNAGLIASESNPPEAVMEAQGSVLTAKYAEGYPGKRWYSGSGPAIDPIEQLVIDRATKLYYKGKGHGHANVQPHSGSNANQEAYSAIIKPGDKVLAPDLPHGGHLTHGHRNNFSARDYKFHFYGVGLDGYLDYDEIMNLAKLYEPDLIVAGMTAYSRVIDFEKFSEIAKEVGAYLMADMAHIAGLVATGLHPNPVEYADIVTSTTQKTLLGPRGGFILCGEELAESVDSAVFPGFQGGPLMHVIAAKGVTFKIASTPEFRKYMEAVKMNASYLAKYMIDAGFDVLTGGTDNHLILVDLNNIGITGRHAAELLETVGITVNKNSIPRDTKSPAEAGGMRIGTPIVTLRGMCEKQMYKIAEYMREVLFSDGNVDVMKRVSKGMDEMCREFPLHDNPELPEGYRGAEPLRRQSGDSLV
jgi:glycine hydroxymethyltransferase